MSPALRALMRPLRIAIIGFGKIAADQHVPAIAGNPRFELAATSSRSGAGPAPSFTDWRELLARGRRPRSGGDHHAAAAALRDRPRVHRAPGCTCLLEKPPTATLGEIDDLACLAEAQRRDPVHHLARAA